MILDTMCHSQPDLPHLQMGDEDRDGHTKSLTHAVSCPQNGRVPPALEVSSVPRTRLRLAGCLLQRGQLCSSLSLLMLVGKRRVALGACCKGRSKLVKFLVASFLFERAVGPLHGRGDRRQAPQTKYKAGHMGCSLPLLIWPEIISDSGYVFPALSEESRHLLSFK